MLDQLGLATLGQTALQFLWEGTIIALALRFALRLGGNHPPTRYALACMALLVLCVAPVKTFWDLDHHISAAPTDARTTSERALLDTPALDRGRLLTSVSASTSLQRLVIDRETFGWFPTAFSLLGCLWLAGAFILSLKLAGGLAAGRRLQLSGVLAAPDLQRRLLALARALGVRTSVRLLQSGHVDVPIVIGWLRPVVLLPVGAVTGLRVDQLELILAHELAHIRRHDYLVNLVQVAAETLLFFHPAVWWVSSEIRSARERCCDDLVVAVCGDAQRYARALAALEGLRRPPPTALAATDGPLLGRVRRLLPETGEARPAHTAGVLAASLLVVLGLGVLLRPAFALPHAGVGPTRLEGVVRWRALPLEGTRVELYRQLPGDKACCRADQLVGATVTGADGAYAFPGIAAGMYAVLAAVPPHGYQPQGYYGFPVFTNATAVQDIFVAKPLEVSGPQLDGPANTPPTLRWRPVPGTARYAVWLTDLDAGPDAPQVFQFADQARLTLNRPLAADKSYVLQVSAYAADGTEIAADYGTTFRTGHGLDAAHLAPGSRSTRRPLTSAEPSGRTAQNRADEPYAPRPATIRMRWPPATLALASAS